MPQPSDQEQPAGRKLHPDFAPLPIGDADRWDLPDPYADISYALEAAGGEFSIADIASVEAYAISSNEARWTPGESIGSELELNMIGTLSDGRWFALDAWNDYTGWGCQDGAEMYVGPTRDDVVANGLTQEARAALGIERV